MWGWGPASHSDPASVVPRARARGAFQNGGSVNPLLYAAGTGFRVFSTPSEQLRSLAVLALGPSEVDLVGGSVF